MGSVDNNEMAESEGKQDEALCPHCLAANNPKAYFCFKCGTPMSSYATMDPIGSIWARGDTWRKAASRPNRPIIFVGMWLLFAGPLLLFLCWAFAAWSPKDTENIVSMEIFIAFGLWAGIIVLYGVILLKTTKNYLRQTKFEKNRPAASEDTAASEHNG